MIQSIVIIGSGNVACHMANALSLQGIKIIQFFGRNENTLKEISIKYNSTFTTSINEIKKNADLYLFCITDSSIEKIAAQLNHSSSFLAHTAGSVSVDVFEKYSSNYGVIYPFQSFSKNRELNYTEIPFCIEANSEANEKKLINLASKISKNILLYNSDQRCTLHLGAVLCSNFVNHLFTLTSEFTNKNNIPFDIYKSLIQETITKALDTNPYDAQTGPARRHDNTIIEKHLIQLKDKTLLQNVYKILSESIKNSYPIK